MSKNLQHLESILFVPWSGEVRTWQEPPGQGDMSYVLRPVFPTNFRGAIAVLVALKHGSLFPKKGSMAGRP